MHLRPIAHIRTSSPFSLPLTSSLKTTRFYSTTPPPCINTTDIPAPHTGRLRILSLNRPAARNAISRQLLHEMRTHIDAIHAEYAADGSEVPPANVFGGAAGDRKSVV